MTSSQEHVHEHALAEDLEPPFIAAIFSDTAVVAHLTECERRPSDEMVSLAPAQLGFLGLETTRDEKGRWLSVAYWKDMTSYTHWRQACIEEMALKFPEAPLESLCKIRVATVEEPVAHQKRKHLTADKPAPVETGDLPSKRRFADVLPSIAGFFGHDTVR